jgi:hypothetical protein
LELFRFAITHLKEVGRVVDMVDMVVDMVGMVDHTIVVMKRKSQGMDICNQCTITRGVILVALVQSLATVPLVRWLSKFHLRNPTAVLHGSANPTLLINASLMELPFLMMDSNTM